MAEKRYLELNPDVGLNPTTGDPEPIASVGVIAAIPRIVKGDLLQEQKRYEIKPADKEQKSQPPAVILPGTRIIETDVPQIADALLQSGQYREIDPPEAKDVEAQRKELAAAVAKAAKQSEEG